MGAVAIFHAPTGYRLVPTEERVSCAETGDGHHRTQRDADREAARLNDQRRDPWYEFRAVPEGGGWRVVAFECALEPVDPEYDALTLCAGCGDVPIRGGCGLRDCPSVEVAA